MAITWMHPLADTDPLTVDAIAQILIQDSEEMGWRDKSKQREDGAVTDTQMALLMYSEDLRGYGATINSRKMAQSIANAVMQDGPLIFEVFEQEQQIVRDNELANRLSADTAPEMQVDGHDNDNETGDLDPWKDEEMLAKAAAIYMNQEDEQVVPSDFMDYDSDTAVEPESSRTAASRPTKGKQLHGVCVACGDKKDFFDVARVPCNHEYCRPCLEELFTLSMKDETLFPPRCDNKEIPLAFVRFFLSSDIAKEFSAKYDELNTKNRTYCFDRRCSEFIPATSVEGDVARCPRCNRTTCTVCKAPSHTGDCPEDTALQELVLTADREQWQRCYQCNRVVELDTGCNHITCYCGAHFCYVCGEKWKSCPCPLWEENRLYNRAAQLVDRDPRRRLYHPDRVAHPQPVVRPPSLARTKEVSPPAEASTVTRTEATAAAVSEWESDFSDNSEWEHDWWLNDTDDLRMKSTQPATGARDVLGATETADARETSEAPEPVRAPENVGIQQPPGNAVQGRPRSPEAQVMQTEDSTRARLIANAVDLLRNHHGCTHEKWRWVKGRFTCEECRHVLREYIFECKQCQIQACNRCRRNRL